MKSKSSIQVIKLILILGIFMLINFHCEKENPHISTNKNAIIFNKNLTYSSVSDIDGNTYKTIVIGTQTWMAENLKTTKYNDGTNIPCVQDSLKWFALTSGAYCYYNNDSTIASIYGSLYNWYASTDPHHNICPLGWHLPTETEWETLATYLGGGELAGKKLKEIGTSHWFYNRSEVNNESGFTALPGGFRYYTGNFAKISGTGSWWISGDFDTESSWFYYLMFNNENLIKGRSSKANGFSIRCIKDQSN